MTKIISVVSVLFWLASGAALACDFIQAVLDGYNERQMIRTDCLDNAKAMDTWHKEAYAQYEKCSDQIKSAWREAKPFPSDVNQVVDWIGKSYYFTDWAYYAYSQDPSLFQITNQKYNIWYKLVRLIECYANGQEKRVGIDSLLKKSPYPECEVEAYYVNWFTPRPGRVILAFEFLYKIDPAAADNALINYFQNSQGHNTYLEFIAGTHGSSLELVGAMIDYSLRDSMNDSFKDTVKYVQKVIIRAGIAAEQLESLKTTKHRKRIIEAATAAVIN